MTSGRSRIASDWPQYLGPARNAVSTETGVSRSWPEEGPEVLWTFPLGEGYAGPAVSQGKVYILDRIGTEQDALRCIDLETGEEEWNFIYDAPGKTGFPGSRSVPAIDGDLIYACGPFGDLFCVSKTTRQPLWQKNIWKDFGGGKIPPWGLAQHPVVNGGKLFVAPQTKEAGMAAFDKKSGEILWKTRLLPGQPSYASPAIVKVAGEEHLIMMSGKPDPKRKPGGKSPDGAVAAYDPETGAELWRYQGWQCQLPIASVTPIGDGRFFITGGYEAGSAMIRVEKNDGGYEVAELFATDDFGTHVHPAVLHEGHLYGHCTTNTRRDGMVCMDIDGNLKWKTGKSPQFDKGGFILVDNLILSVDGKKGILFLIEPNPEEFKPLAQAQLLDTAKCWAPLALSNGKLLIRDQQQMKCVNVR